MEKKIGFLKAKTVMYIGLLLLFSGIMNQAFGDATSNDDKFFEVGDLILGSIFTVIAIFAPGQESQSSYNIKIWRKKIIISILVVIFFSVFLQFFFTDLSQTVRFSILLTAVAPLIFFRLQYEKRAKRRAEFGPDGSALRKHDN